LSLYPIYVSVSRSSYTRKGRKKIVSYLSTATSDAKGRDTRSLRRPAYEPAPILSASPHLSLSKMERIIPTEPPYEVHFRVQLAERVQSEAQRDLDEAVRAKAAKMALCKVKDVEYVSALFTFSCKGYRQDVRRAKPTNLLLRALARSESWKAGSTGSH
jgi:hypothetical protein